MIATAKLPGPSACLRSHFTGNADHQQRGDRRMKCIGLDGKTRRNQCRTGATHGRHFRHQWVPIGERHNALARQ